MKTENFDYDEFMAKEFPKSTKDKLPLESTLKRHLDKLTSFLFDCSLQSVKEHDHKKNSNKPDAHITARYILVSNYRIRTLNLFRVLEELPDIEENFLFDEGTANIILRSLLENYLIYYQLYNGSSRKEKLQEIYFDLFNLSSLLQFKKYESSVKGETKTKDYSREIAELVQKIKANPNFNSLNKKVRNAIEKIGDGKQDYLSYTNFNALIRESPLPTNFFTDFYSYSSSFAHSEAFSLNISKSIYASKANWKKINSLMKVNIFSKALYICSDFVRLFIEYDKTELEDEKEREIWEAVSLCQYYIGAMNNNE